MSRLSKPVMIQAELFDLPELDDETRLANAFDSAWRALVKKQSRPPLHARFYPYAGISSTIRLRNGRAYARVSDVLRQAPPDVLRALACILVAKLYKLRVPSEHERVYRQHLLQPDVVRASESARRSRGFKITTSSRGNTYDLNEMFDALNRRYFGGRLQKPRISWGQKRARRVLGHHDHVHDAIILNPSLDARNVPAFVVEYVLYHEMLHVKHRPRLAGSRTVYHSREFRAEERRFEQYRAAISWLEDNRPVARGRRRKGSRTYPVELLGTKPPG